MTQSVNPKTPEIPAPSLRGESDAGIFVKMRPALRGAGESFPCRGRLRGQRPLKVLFFQRPCETSTQTTKNHLSATRRGTENSRRGVRGEWGQRPRPPRECKNQCTKVRVRVGEAGAHCETPSPPAPLPQAGEGRSQFGYSLPVLSPERERGKFKGTSKNHEPLKTLKAQRKAGKAEGISGFLAFDLLCVLSG
jgi:hypothetical protein